MIFEYLKDQEKIYWLNYVAKIAELHQEKINALSNVSIHSGMHPKRMLLLKEVNTFYKSICVKIQEELYDLVPKELLLTKGTLSFSYKKINLYFLGYLIRDWSSNQIYNQRTIIIAFIEEKLKSIGVKEENKALFFGCGTGRYAVDLAYRYDQVEAFDASVFMLWSIKHLQRMKTWDVLEKVDRNCRKMEDTVQRFSLEMTKEQATIINEKVNFFWADAANVPLPDNSINHIYSIYFTDVLPLTVLFEEANRLLMDKGLFIHFGPLEYFFDTEHEMLSAEEVRLFFEEKGYRILSEAFLETRHLYIPNKMRYRVYDNWFFVAQKIKTPLPNRISVKDVLCLNNAVEIEAKVVVEQGECSPQIYSASLGDQSYNLPAIVYELLLNINGTATIEDLFEKLNLENVLKEDKEQLLSILQELLTEGFIRSKID